MTSSIQPLATALARLEHRWGSAAIRLGNGQSASAAVPGRMPRRLDGTAPAEAGTPWPAGAVTPFDEGALAPALRPVAPPAPAEDPLAPLDPGIVSTGFAALDAILGPGGLARQASVTLRGSDSSGKTTLALRLIAEAQAKGAIAAYLDLGRTFDPLEAVTRGVNLAWLLVVRAADPVEGLRLAGALLAGRSVEVLVVDLPDRLPSSREALLRGLSARARQVGARLVILEPRGLPPPVRGTLAEMAGVGLELERRSWIRLGRDVVGQRTLVTVAKNRYGPPGRRVELEIRYADEGDRGRGVGRLLDAPPARPAAALRALDPERTSPPASVPSSHATALPGLAPSAAPSRAGGASTPRRSARARRPAVGVGHRPRLQPVGPSARRAPRDDPGGRAQARP